MKKILLALLLVLPVFASAEEVEKIRGYSVDLSGVTFHVSTWGCTEKEHFRVKPLETFPVQLQLIRTQKDICEFREHGKSINFTWAELGLSGGSEFTIVNSSAVFTVAR